MRKEPASLHTRYLSGFRTLIAVGISFVISFLVLNACSNNMDETTNAENIKDSEVTPLRDVPNKKVNAGLFTEVIQSIDKEAIEFETLTIEVFEDGVESKGSFEVDLYQPQEEYELDDDVIVKLDAYFPSYYMNDDLEPASYSDYPLNPAFALQVIGPDQADAIFFGIGIEVIANEDSNVYSLEMIDYTVK